jgi:hypothetical protein
MPLYSCTLRFDCAAPAGLFQRATFWRLPRQERRGVDAVGDGEKGSSSTLVHRAVTERRSHARYPIELDVRYIGSWTQRIPHEGSGKTRDFSSGGIFFSANQPLPKGHRVKLFINWPIPLNGTCPLQLVITGQIVRSSRDGVAVTILNHEFRTRGRYAGAPASIASNHNP